MKKGKMLYESLIDVKSDYVEQAENLTFKRKRPNAFVRWGVAAAACLALAAALTLVIYKAAQKPENVTALVPTDMPALPTAVPTAAPTLAPTTAPTAAPTETPRIICGESGQIPESTFGYDVGTVNVVGTLKRAIDEEENENTVFYVRIQIENIQPEKTRELWNYYSLELAEAERDPAYREFISFYTEWYGSIEYYALTETERNRFEKEWRYYEKYNEIIEEFFEYASGFLPSEKVDELRAAQQRTDEAAFKYEHHDLPPELREEIQAEIERLVGCGYDLDTNTLDTTYRNVCAKLTKEQIDNFVGNRNYIYFIYFAGLIAYSEE